VYGQFDRIRGGYDLAIVAMGNMVYRALKIRELLAAEGRSAAVYGLSCPLCITPRLLKELGGFKLVVTYEDHDASTGMGARMALAFSGEPDVPPLYRAGVTEYGASGDPEDLYRQQGLLPEQMASRILRELS